MICLLCNDDFEQNYCINACNNNHIFCNKCWKHWIVQSLTINNIVCEIDLDYGEPDPRFGNDEDEIYCPICGLESTYIKNGTYIGYYKEGGKMFEINYKDNKLNGLYRIYHPIKYGVNKIKKEINYIEGVKNGTYISTYNNGNIFETYQLVNGNIEGLRIINNFNGSIYISSEYKNGLMNGIQTTYYSNGTKGQTFWENNKFIKNVQIT